MLPKRRITFEKFLSSDYSNNYITQSLPYEQQIAGAAEMLCQSKYVLIGAGSGMSTAAGAVYGGKWFEVNFAEFQEKYGKGPLMQDMYGAGFYPYPSEEAYWGYWSKQCLKAGIDADLTPLHRVLLDMLKEKKIFCLSTNADGQFVKAGLPEDRIFCTQGDYFHIQCAKGCHQRVYDAVDLFRKMDESRKDCLIPGELVPKCPVCKGKMNMNLRIDGHFVQDIAWYEAERRFGDFLSEAMDSGEKVCLLELGVGFNTPTIIRFPFENLMRRYTQMSLVRLNLNQAVIPADINKRSFGINADLKQSITDLAAAVQKISESAD